MHRSWMIAAAASFAISITLFASACGGASSSPAEPSAEASGAMAPSSAATVEAPPPVPGPPPTGKIVDVTPSKESEKYLHVEISFENQGATACKILGYTLSWSGGKKDITLDGFSVPPKDAKTRSVKVHPSDGNVDTLKKEDATIAVRSDCGG